MDTALVVACISAVVALVSAAFSGWTQLQVAKREKEVRSEKRRSDANVILDRYRGPLLDAAWQDQTIDLFLIRLFRRCSVPAPLQFRGRADVSWVRAIAGLGRLLVARM